MNVIPFQPDHILTNIQFITNDGDSVMSISQECNGLKIRYRVKLWNDNYLGSVGYLVDGKGTPINEHPDLGINTVINLPVS